MIHTIKTLESLSFDEIAHMAQTAAESGESNTNPFPERTERYFYYEVIFTTATANLNNKETTE